MKDLVITYDPEQFDHEFGDDNSPQIPSISAAAALIRNAGEFPGVELLPAEKPYRDNLEKDGSQFILISCALLERFGVPPDARDFALWMEGIANGNFKESFRCTDEQIANVYGYTERWVREKRAALLEWQRAKKTTIVEVIEKKFNRETGKNDPTEYIVHIGLHVSRFIRNARDNKFFQRNPVRAIEEAEDSGLIELVEEEKDELNPDLSIRRKEKKETQPPKDDKVVKQGDIRRRILRAAEKWSDLEYGLNGEVSGGWADLCGELDRIVGAARQRFEAKESQGRLSKQRGRPRK
jgi:hypothetical protein